MSISLLRYSVSRIFQTFFVLIGVSLVVFLILYVLIPSNPVEIQNIKASKKTREALSHELGLDKPIYIQYFNYIGRLLKGDLGVSYRYKESVSNLLAEALPKTFQLALLTVLVELLLGTVAAVVSYLIKRSFIDIFLIVATTFFISVPIFWLAMLLQYWLGLRLLLLPVSGADSWQSVILPTSALAFYSTALVVKILRASLKETESKAYTLLARAKGLSESQVLLKHQLKNAFSPALTYIGMDFGTLMTGAVAVEIVFNWPGVGLLIYEAVMQRDFPLILSVVLVLVFIYIIVNLVVDLLYGFFNPEVRDQR